MDNQKKIQDTLIDRYYNEEYDQGSLSCINDDDMEAFDRDMTYMTERLNILSEHEADVDINIMGIIVQAEAIKAKRKNRIENILFICFAAAVLYTIAMLTLSLGIKFIIIFEAVGFVLVPFSLIPISRAVLMRRRHEQ